jgi:hypothetical protein
LKNSSCLIKPLVQTNTVFLTGDTKMFKGASIIAAVFVSLFAAQIQADDAGMEIQPMDFISAPIASLALNPALYNAFPVQAYATVNPGMVTVSVYNAWGYPIVCRGQVSAITARGFSGTMYFQTAAFFPGNWGYAYLTTNAYYDPIVNAWAQAWCQVAY